MHLTDPYERSIADAKAHFAECVRDAESGRSTVLTRHGRPVARIEPYRDQGPTAPIDDTEVREPGTVRETTPSADEPGPRGSAGKAFVSAEAHRTALRRLLEEEIWPHIPAHLRGCAPSREDREQILGYSEDGV